MISAFNRTKVELKLPNATQAASMWSSFNRTKVELK